MKLSWYFDFISPFAYLQLKQFKRLPAGIEIDYKPVLLAGLLKHWGNVGPAEIAPKRIFTYQHCHWQAHSRGIAFKMPPAHPFNSLPALRLAIAMDCDPDAIETIFEMIWQQGLAIDSPQAISQLQADLKLDSIESLISQPQIKAQLKLNTEQAAADQVFGVPSFVVHQSKNNEHAQPQLFWGLDAFDMLLDYLSGDEFFNNNEWQRVSHLPVGVQRQR